MVESNPFVELQSELFVLLLLGGQYIASVDAAFVICFVSEVAVRRVFLFILFIHYFRKFQKLLFDEFYLSIISGSECLYCWRSVARCIWSSELPVCRNQLRGNEWYSWVRIQVVLPFPFELMIQVQCIGVSSFGIAFHY